MPKGLKRRCVAQEGGYLKIRPLRGGRLFVGLAAMLAGNDVVIASRFGVAEEIERRPDAAAEGTAAFERVALFRRRHRLEPFDHRRRDDHHLHLQAAAPADGVKMRLFGIPIGRLEEKLRLAADRAGDLI